MGQLLGFSSHVHLCYGINSTILYTNKIKILFSAVFFKITIFRSPGLERFNFWELRHKYTDATIVCGKRKSKIKGHKIILASASLFFRKGLETSKVICLPDIEKEEF
jgi:hypothetical protein